MFLTMIRVRRRVGFPEQIWGSTTIQSVMTRLRGYDWLERVVVAIRSSPQWKAILSGQFPSGGLDRNLDLFPGVERQRMEGKFPFLFDFYRRSVRGHQ